MIDSKPHRKILVAPLNWGLGHATRCIPIIDALIDSEFSPILGGDGKSLDLLRKEFPDLPFYELPATEVTYSKKGSFLKFKLLSQAPNFLKGMSLENEKIQEIHHKENLSGIISDNRFATRLDEVPSVYITHQIKVLSGKTSFLSTSLHQKIISKFHQCWVPDYPWERLAGELSAPINSLEGLKYIGPLSRFTKKPSDKLWDLVVILSGPEPQRQYLEDKIMNQLKSFSGKCLLVRGIVEEKQSKEIFDNITITNFMLQQELRDAIEAGRMIISRSGYSTIMDLEALEAKTFFIPTPGQFEQEYLAEHLEKMEISGFSDQASFDVNRVYSDKRYAGFKHKKTSNHVDISLFDVFRE